MLVAVCDQLFGTSTSSWRKIVTPFSFPITAVRFSHSTASKGDFFPSVKYRSKVRPFPVLTAVFSAASVARDFSFNACFTVAIRPSALQGSRSRREPYYFTPLRPAEAPRFTSGSWLKLTHLPIRLVRESGQRIKRPAILRSHSSSSANRQYPAVGRWFTLSLTAASPA